MLSVQGIYDGKKLKLFEQVNIHSPKKVIITFLDTIDEDPNSEELHFLLEKNGSLDFLKSKDEDIYSDKDLKVKY